MCIEALSSAHKEQKNSLEILAFPSLERVKTESDLCAGDALFAMPEKTSITLYGCIGPTTYHYAFKEMFLLALK
ncbi:hypothetical protein TNCV_295361 [Trichonephila clavipes]|nr:hypothetical protein TNCV_295361 [Trichonephila clavipes]